jgi:hypothetical protein
MRLSRISVGDTRRKGEEGEKGGEKEGEKGTSLIVSDTGDINNQ